MMGAYSFGGFGLASSGTGTALLTVTVDPLWSLS
jgi:hypothetical protein